MDFLIFSLFQARLWEAPEQTNGVLESNLYARGAQKVMRHSKQSFISIFSSKIKKAPTLLKKSRFLWNFMKFDDFHINLKHSQSFQKAPGAFCALSQAPRRLYFTQKLLEAPEAPRRLIRTLTSKRRLCFVWFTKMGDLFTKLSVWSFFDTSRNSKGARGSCLTHKHPRM